eukprot:CAMPEP_0185268448 /NCGR_PEP_ID=MMETSP1359-20130426/37089_1 /TAXON_ID=552665 /ORGANISM="Bigelowiella longifila, Strain CCMP242" /LENGTH=61 /DNA_ID=CAMNT_0027859211 /DNA_START=86 /DNA_END=268 /DNA_ORIENTATION=-
MIEAVMFLVAIAIMSCISQHRSALKQRHRNLGAACFVLWNFARVGVFTVPESEEGSSSFFI